MKLSDALKTKRADLIDRLEALSKKAADEERLFDATEAEQWDKLTAEVRDLDRQITRQLEAEDLRRGGRGVPVLLNERGEPLTVLRNADKLADRHRGGSAELAAQFSVGHAVRGIATGRWEGRDALQRAMNEGTGPAGQYAVPTPLSAQWLDLARSQAVLGQAGAITVPMESQTLRIAGLATDVVPAFRAELTDFPTSNNNFRALDLRARTIGVISEMSIELMADSPNASQMVEASMVGAMAVALDLALIAGDGVVVSPADNPLGILGWSGIGATATVGVPADYSKWLAAMADIATANHVPATVIDTPATAYFLAGLATGISGDKSPLRPPAPYEAMQKLMSTVMPPGTSLVGDFTKSGWGLRESVTIEATRLSDTALKKGMVQIRAFMRLDTFVTHAAAFHKLTGITAAAADAAVRRAA